MLMWKRIALWMTHAGIALALSSFFLSQVSFGAAVKACRKLKESRFIVEGSRSDEAQKRVFCTIAPPIGTVGDYIEIKNQSNYIVAVGRIIKQGKASTVVALTKSKPDEGSMAGYPVLLRINENQDYWTATSAPF